MVVVDKLTKAAHFMAVKSTSKASNIVDIYMKEIARFHRNPKAIVSNQDPKFISIFWRGLSREFRTKLNVSIEYHPQTYK